MAYTGPQVPHLLAPCGAETGEPSPARPRRRIPPLCGTPPPAPQLCPRYSGGHPLRCSPGDSACESGSCFPSTPVNSPGHQQALRAVCAGVMRPATTRCRRRSGENRRPAGLAGLSQGKGNLCTVGFALVRWATDGVCIPCPRLCHTQLCEGGRKPLSALSFAFLSPPTPCAGWRAKHRSCQCSLID